MPTDRTLEPMQIARAKARLEALPRSSLGQWPTPLHRIERFGAAIGTEVWIKRDDIQSVTLAGNKLRKFDLVLGEALAAGRDTLVTTGAQQSNSARTGAAAATALGMQAVLLLGGRAPAKPTANLLIDVLVGAEIRYAGNASWAELEAGVNDIVAELHRRGRRPVAAPVGCSSPLGALGFARAFLELDAQLEAAGLRPTAVVHTSTSGGTHAGLVVGRALARSSVPIIAVDVGAIYDDPNASIAALANEAARLIGLDLDLTGQDLWITTDQLGDGYGAPTSAGEEAIDLLARTEAILVDPVYSGKGLAGLVEMVRSGLGRGPIVFWHTGGYHALFR